MIAVFMSTYTFVVFLDAQYCLALLRRVSLDDLLLLRHKVLFRFALDTLSVENSLLKVVYIVSIWVHVLTFNARFKDSGQLINLVTNLIIHFAVNCTFACDCIDLAFDVFRCELQLPFVDYSINFFKRSRSHLLVYPGLRQYRVFVIYSYFTE